jgi:trk system potassium uptake protein TrkA
MSKTTASIPIPRIMHNRGVKILVIGAGQVGSTIVEALHHEHDITVIDLDQARLSPLAHRYDVVTVEANGASRRALQDAGIANADLVIACTSRDEANIVAAMLARALSGAKTIVRTMNVEYLDIWRERQLDVDFVVASEVETANAIARIIGMPAAKQTDIFADGQVEIVEFDVPDDLPLDETVGLPLREARIPVDSKVASVIRGDNLLVARGDEAIKPGDRVIVIGSPTSVREWSDILSHGAGPVDDVVVYGAGRTGRAVARTLLAQGIRVRLIEPNADKARIVAEDLSKVRVFNATGLDPDFLERERIGQTRAAVFAMGDDAKNLYAATLTKILGVRFTIAVVDDPISLAVLERAGVDVAVNPRLVTAEEIVRFAHDPRIRQLTMLEGDRFEVLDITVREDSELVGIPFRELPLTGSLIGAIVRDGNAIFPHGNDVLLPGDRAILFTESSRVARVERVL